MVRMIGSRWQMIGTNVETIDERGINSSWEFAGI